MLDYLRLISTHEWEMITIAAIATMAFLLLFGSILGRFLGRGDHLELPIRRAVSPEESRKRIVRQAILSTLSEKYSTTRIQLSDETPLFITAYDINSTLAELVNEGLVVIHPASPENVPDPEHSEGFDEIIKVKRVK